MKRDRVENFSKMAKDAISGWTAVEEAEELPQESGLFMIYDDTSDDCLYVGTAIFLRQECKIHWAWIIATDSFSSPYITYKLEKEEELHWQKYLLLVLFRPAWNYSKKAIEQEEKEEPKVSLSKWLRTRL